MNEFIVWDKENKKFVENLTGYYLDKDCLLWKEECSKYECDLIIATDCICFPHIGKTDINNEKIYADCSIFEFAFKGFGEVFAESYIGYFVWNDFRLRYDIKIINKSDKDGDSYIFDYGKCLPNIINNEFKIIDTLQENKLGLIK